MANTQEVLGVMKLYTKGLIGTEFRDHAVAAADREELLKAVGDSE